MDPNGARFLLSDNLGNLLLLLLLREGEGEDGGASGSAAAAAASGSDVTGLKLEPLGRTPAASSLSYLDSGVVFVGSAFGDSQLIRCALLDAVTVCHLPAARRRSLRMPARLALLPLPPSHSFTPTPSPARHRPANRRLHGTPPPPPHPAT